MTAGRDVLEVGGDAAGGDAPAPDAAVANRSVLRALGILELLSCCEEPLTLVEVAARLKIPKSSALSLLRALVAREFCATDPKGRYGLAVRTFEVGAAYLRSMTPVRSVTPELHHLTESLGVTSHYAVLDEDEVVYLAKHDPPGLGLKLASSLGARLPAALTAVGKAQLAFRAPLRPSAAPDRRPQAPRGAGAMLAAQLEEVRALGYAVDDGETALGIRCVAAPLFNDHGCCGAIGVSYLLGAAAAPAGVEQAVVEAAARASGRLGGKVTGAAGAAGAAGVPGPRAPVTEPRRPAARVRVAQAPVRATGSPVPAGSAAGVQAS